MKNKREVLKSFAETGVCQSDLDCIDCPYKRRCNKLLTIIKKIGARKLLKMFPEIPEKRVFDKSKILTCVTADQAKVGMKGYFGDSIKYLREYFDENNIAELKSIRDETYCERFESKENIYWCLFYPIDEVEE